MPEQYIPPRDAAELGVIRRVPYTPAHAEILLKVNKRDIPNIFPSEILGYIMYMNAYIPRIVTGIEQDKVTYNGPWFLQKGETCAPFALVNSLTKIGVDIDPESLTEMINHTINADGIETGVPFKKLAKELNENQKLKAKATRHTIYTYQPERLLRKDMFPAIKDEYDEMLKGYPRKPFDEWTENQKAIRQHLAQKTSFQYTARTIKRLLDQGSAVNVRINEVERYYNSVGSSHQICIAGYAVDSVGRMNVQVIDSNFGIFWTSLEHIAASFSKDHTVWSCHAIEPV